MDRFCKTTSLTELGDFKRYTANQPLNSALRLNDRPDPVSDLRRRVELARQYVITPTEIIHGFIHLIADHPAATSDCYRLLPSDLANEVKELVETSTPNWCSQVQLADAAIVQEQLHVYIISILNCI